jgi:transposase
MRPSTITKVKLVELHLSRGKTIREVAELVRISKSTVQRIKADLNLDIPTNKGGRIPKLSTRYKAFCVRSVVKDGKQNATEVKNALKESQEVVVSSETVRRALKGAGLMSFVKPKKPLLKKNNVKARLSYAKEHLDWTLDDWRRVIWSDETKICRFGSDGHHYSWKKVGERLQPKHVKQVVKHGGTSLMVWGCITYDGPGYICKIDSTLDKELYKTILETDLVESMDYYGYQHKDVIFQHDNDPKHTAKVVTEYLDKQPFETMVWPAQSPDLNPIENIWSLVKLRLFRNYDEPPKGKHHLWERVQEVWNAITPDECKKVIDSMPKRCSEVIKAKGYWIDY